MNLAPPSIGDVVRARLRELGWTQIDLAIVLGRRGSPAYVKHRLSGVHRMRAQDAVLFGAALGLSPLDLLMVQARHQLHWAEVDAVAVARGERAKARAVELTARKGKQAASAGAMA